MQYIQHFILKYFHKKISQIRTNLKMVVTYSESLRDLGVGLKDDLLKNIHRLDYLYFNIDST